MRRGTGGAAERRALRHYRLRGYRVLGTNVWAGGYELDLVVRRGRRVVFVEVKSKSSARYGSALEMVGPEKVRRIRRAAASFLAARPELRGLAVRFDVVAEQAGKLERFPSAF
ncbi:MAG TPA: YraN family protein [Gaiellaceae bacterium]|nr:YraN family protein [Gaiellaceae bacterium]